MPITQEQNTKILGYAQIGYMPDEIYTLMQRIGEPVALSTLYKHVARMKQDGEWDKWERSGGAV
jgi:hypothetical protein